MFGFSFKKDKPKAVVEHSSLLPSIWVGEFASQAEWLGATKRVEQFLTITDAIDDELLKSRHCFTRNAWCAVCGCMQTMHFRWYFSHGNEAGSMQPAWSETLNCNGCGLNSRMRAVFSLLQNLQIDEKADIYVTEAVTDGFKCLKDRYVNAIGSEYLGTEKKSGVRYNEPGAGLVLHQDLTALSFENDSFDAIISQEVFEHIPDYRKAFSECGRVLRKGGRLIFTIPFFQNQASTEIRATVDGQGNLKHLLPPEYHGNPVDSAGSLCFQHFGWDILDDLRHAGFEGASAYMYWGPWQGHMGAFFFVFEARMAR